MNGVGAVAVLPYQNGLFVGRHRENRRETARLAYEIVGNDRTVGQLELVAAQPHMR